MRKIIGLILFALSLNAMALALYPTQIHIEGKAGTRANIQFKVYGHPEHAMVDIIMVKDILSDDETILTSIELGKEQQMIIPIDIITEQTKDFYVCAALKQSYHVSRLRVCSPVRQIVNNL